MGAKIVKPVAFLAPLAALALLMEWGERIEGMSCAKRIGFEKARQILEERSDVLDVAPQAFQAVDDCRFAMQGYADVETGEGLSRRRFELVLAFDKAARRWKQADLSLTE